MPLITLTALRADPAALRDRPLPPLGQPGAVATTHNTVIEIVWTLVPVLILVAIAGARRSRLLATNIPAQGDLTVKGIGNQWYWTYPISGHGDFRDRLERPVRMRCQGPRRAAPARGRRADGRSRRRDGEGCIVTSNDVLHAFGVPGLLGRRSTPFPAASTRPGSKASNRASITDKCYELCGARHGYMPIAVEVVPPAQYAAWVASKGGTHARRRQADFVRRDAEFADHEHNPTWFRPRRQRHRDEPRTD
jgi:cytochrome c oxidase subunit 2